MVGINATRVVVTTLSHSDWLFEAVIISRDSKLYSIHNSAITTDMFEEFYSSFRLLD